MLLYHEICINSSLDAFILLIFTLTFYVNNCIIDLCNYALSLVRLYPRIVEKPYEGGNTMIKEIQEIIGEITSISPEIEVRADRIMVMFEYIIPDEETTKKIETALSRLGKVRPLHCREYDIICWSLYR